MNQHMNQQERNIALSQALTPEFIDSIDFNALNNASIDQIRDIREQLQDEINNLVTDINNYNNGQYEDGFNIDEAREELQTARSQFMVMDLAIQTAIMNANNAIQAYRPIRNFPKVPPKRGNGLKRLRNVKKYIL